MNLADARLSSALEGRSVAILSVEPCEVSKSTPVCQVLVYDCRNTSSPVRYVHAKESLQQCVSHNTFVAMRGDGDT